MYLVIKATAAFRSAVVGICSVAWVTSLTVAVLGGNE